MLPVVHTPTRQTESSPKRGKLKIAAEILAVCVLGGLAFTANTHAAQTKITDPRKCSTNTPGGQARHAYWCAHNAAVTTVRTVLARRQKAARWYAPVFCSQDGPLLRWSCQSFLGGDKWVVAVRWTATSTGWHRYASVAQTKQ